MGSNSELAAGDGFASEAGGFFDAFFFGLGGPIVPRFSESGVFASEVNSGYGVGGDDLPLGTQRFIQAGRRKPQLGPLGPLEGDRGDDRAWTTAVNPFYFNLFQHVDN